MTLLWWFPNTDTHYHLACMPCGFICKSLEKFHLSSVVVQLCLLLHLYFLAACFAGSGQDSSW